VTDSLDSVPRSAVKAPLGIARPVVTLGPAIWLYLAFIVAAGTSGRVIRTRSRLAKDLAVPESSIDGWLTQLVEAGLVTVQSPLPFLVLTLRFWSGSTANERAEAGNSRGRTDAALDNVPGKSRAEAIALNKYSAGDRGLGEGETLRTEVLAVLPDIDPDELGRILARYPAETIRRAITRVKGTPEQAIRKSKAALFRYLLARLPQAIHANHL
jgi:hypothetical protein